MTTLFEIHVVGITLIKWPHNLKKNIRNHTPLDPKLNVEKKNLLFSLNFYFTCSGIINIYSAISK